MLDFWTSPNGGLVIEAKMDLENPLENIIKDMKINFNNGGIFNINRVRWGDNSNQYLDF